MSNSFLTQTLERASKLSGTPTLEAVTRPVTVDQIAAELRAGYDKEVAPVVEQASPEVRATHDVTKAPLQAAGAKILDVLNKAADTSPKEALETINKIVKETAGKLGIDELPSFTKLPSAKEVGEKLSSITAKVHEQYEKLNVPSFSDAQQALNNELAKHTEAQVKLGKAVDKFIGAAKNPLATAKEGQEAFKFAQQALVDELAKYEKAEIALGKAVNTFMDAAEHPLQTMGEATQEVKEKFAFAQQALVDKLAEHPDLQLKIGQAANALVDVAQNPGKTMNDVAKDAKVKFAFAQQALVDELAKHQELQLKIGQAANTLVDTVEHPEKLVKTAKEKFAFAQQALSDKLAEHPELQQQIGQAANALIDAVEHPGQTLDAAKEKFKFAQQALSDKLAEYPELQQQIGKAANALVDAVEHPGKTLEAAKEKFAFAQQALSDKLAENPDLQIKIGQAANAVVDVVEHPIKTFNEIASSAKEKFAFAQQALSDKLAEHPDLQVKIGQAANAVVDAVKNPVKTMTDIGQAIKTKFAATQQAIKNELAKHEGLQVAVGQAANAVVDAVNNPGQAVDAIDKKLDDVKKQGGVAGAAATVTKAAFDGQVAVAKVGVKVAKSVGGAVAGWASSAFEFVTHTKEKAISARIAEINGGHNGKTEYDVTNAKDLETAKTMLELHTEKTERKGQTLGEVMRDQQKVVPFSPLGDPKTNVKALVANANLPAGDKNKKNMIVLDKATLDALKTSDVPGAKEIYKDSTTKVKMLLREEARIRTDENTKEIVKGAQVIEVAMAAPVIVGGAVMLAPAAIAVGGAAAVAVGGGAAGAVVGTVTTAAVGTGALIGVDTMLNTGEKIYEKVTGTKIIGGHVALTSETTNKFLDNPTLENFGELAKKAGIDTVIGTVTLGAGKGFSAVKGAMVGKAEVAAMSEAQTALVKAETALAAAAGKPEEVAARKALKVAQEHVVKTAKGVATKMGVATTGDLQEELKGKVVELAERVGVDKFHAKSSGQPKLGLVARLKAAATILLPTALVGGTAAQTASAATPEQAPNAPASQAPAAGAPQAGQDSMKAITDLQKDQATIIKNYVDAKKEMGRIEELQKRTPPVAVDARVLETAKNNLATTTKAANDNLPGLKDKIGKLATDAAKKIPATNRTPQQQDDFVKLARVEEVNKQQPTSTAEVDRLMSTTQREPEQGKAHTGIPILDMLIDLISSLTKSDFGKTLGLKEASGPRTPGSRQPAADTHEPDAQAHDRSAPVAAPKREVLVLKTLASQGLTDPDEIELVELRAEQLLRNNEGMTVEAAVKGGKDHLQEVKDGAAAEAGARGPDAVKDAVGTAVQEERVATLKDMVTKEVELDIKQAAHDDKVAGRETKEVSPAEKAAKVDARVKEVVEKTKGSKGALKTETKAIEHSVDLKGLKQAITKQVELEGKDIGKNPEQKAAEIDRRVEITLSYIAKAPDPDWTLKHAPQLIERVGKLRAAITKEVEHTAKITGTNPEQNAAQIDRRTEMVLTSDYVTKAPDPDLAVQQMTQKIEERVARIEAREARQQKGSPALVRTSRAAQAPAVESPAAPQAEQAAPQVTSNKPSPAEIATRLSKALDIDIQVSEISRGGKPLLEFKAGDNLDQSKNAAAGMKNGRDAIKLGVENIAFAPQKNGNVIIDANGLTESNLKQIEQNAIRFKAKAGLTEHQPEQQRQQGSVPQFGPVGASRGRLGGTGVNTGQFRNTGAPSSFGGTGLQGGQFKNSGVPSSFGGTGLGGDQFAGPRHQPEQPHHEHNGQDHLPPLKVVPEPVAPPVRESAPEKPLLVPNHSGRGGKPLHEEPHVETGTRSRSSQIPSAGVLKEAMTAQQEMLDARESLRDAIKTKLQTENKLLPLEEQKAVTPAELRKEFVAATTRATNSGKSPAAALKEEAGKITKVAHSKAMEVYQKSVEAVAKADPMITDKDAFVKRVMETYKNDFAKMQPEELVAAAQKNMGKAEAITEQVKAAIAKAPPVVKEHLAEAAQKVADDIAKGDFKAAAKDSAVLVSDMNKAMEAVKGLNLDSLRLSVSMSKVSDKTLGELSAPAAGGGKGASGPTVP